MFRSTKTFWPNGLQLAMSEFKRVRERSFIVVLMDYGSTLYGTSTKKSDDDFKGIFLPTPRELFLGKIPKAWSYKTKADPQGKNTSGDIDVEIYSLHYFIELAIQGQTVAIDMLHAPLEKTYITSDPWEEIKSLRSKFYTKNMNAFVGYANRQAAKYGLKSGRLHSVKNLIKFLRSEDYTSEDKLAVPWEQLPIDEYSKYIEDSPNGIRQYQICGKICQETQTIGYTIPILEKFVDVYGERARQAEANEGIDWKAVSHAIRAALQLKEIFLTGNLILPLKDADLLIKIKQGKLHYVKEVAPILEGLMDEITALASKSLFPNKVNRTFWEDFIIRTIYTHVL